MSLPLPLPIFSRLFSAAAPMERTWMPEPLVGKERGDGLERVLSHLMLLQFLLPPPVLGQVGVGSGKGQRRRLHIKSEISLGAATMTSQLP